MKISIETARRFVLGEQGLWPARRLSGKAGTEEAMRLVQHVQLDPLDIGARAHDLILHSRVRGYKKSHYSELVYQDRKFFEWGAWLATRPIEEWPYWKVIMERSYKRYRKNWTKISSAQYQSVLKTLEDEGARRNRHFQGGRIEKTYRGSKVSSLALYQLWIRGDVVCSNRERFERIYDLTHRFVPEHLLEPATEAETDSFMVKKEAAFHGLSRLEGLGSLLHITLDKKKQARLRERMLTEGIITEVLVEGWKDPHYVLTESLDRLKTLENGKIPKEWQTKGAHEVQLLSPLDIVSARGRAKKLFDFDYIWEVYKPLEKRRWGYYTLPVLYGDRLVARLDPSLDRKSGVMNILGFWFEDPKIKKDDEFMNALKKSILEMQSLFEAKSISTAKISDRAIKNLLKT